MKKLVLVLLLAVTAGAAAQTPTTAQKELRFSTQVKDHTNHKAIDSLTAVLLAAKDSVLIDSVKTNYWSWGDEGVSFIDGRVPGLGRYLIRIDAEGYETKYYPVNVEKIYKRENTIELPTIYMRRAPKKIEKTLDEVTVTATRLKFYMDGDTLVYSADAFDMAEGSMLDALIKKLPGVELKSGGEITVNGKKVDALLLNGKDFFDSDRELLLDNMPAFMVKNIQSYERVPERLKGTRRGQTEQKEVVMNVKLRRDYNEGWLATFEAGAGGRLAKPSNASPFSSQTSFLGRAFATRFDNRSRLVLFANANNVSDTRDPGEKGDWSPLTQATGLTTVYRGGLNYRIEEDDHYSYEGAASASYNDSDNRQYQTSQTFLQGGDTWGRDMSRSRNYTWNFQTNHRLALEGKTSLFKRRYLNLTPTFSYNKYRNNAQSASASFLADITPQLGKAWLDSIQAPQAGALMRQYAINRTLTQQRGNGHTTQAGLRGDAYLTPLHNDFVEFGAHASYDYSDRQADAYEHYRLEYLQQASQDLRNRYTPTLERSHTASASAFTYLSLDQKGRHTININADYRYSHADSNRPIYMLHEIEEWGPQGEHALGELPSYDAMLRTIDQNNSRHTIQTTHTVEPALEYAFNLGSDTTAVHHFALHLNLPVAHEQLRYEQGTHSEQLRSRTTHFLSPGFDYFHFMPKTMAWAQFTYRMTTQAPGILSLIDQTDTSNPLMVTRPNTNQKNQQTHTLFGMYRNKFGRVMMNASTNFALTRNAFASALIFDKLTGVSTLTPTNVNGNWNASLRGGVDFPVWREKIRINTQTSYAYQHSVDLTGTDLALGTLRSTVRSHNIDEELAITYQPRTKYEFGLKGNVHHQRSSSTREDFTPIHVTDFDYGLTVKLELPLDFQLSTDLSMYSRRGYTDASMNTNELVWNARLSKRFLHGRLTLIADGFDLLGNLSNVRRTLNAQGRQESYYNVMPSYGLVHVVYRFNKMPRK